MLGAFSIFSLADGEGNMEARYSFKMLFRSFSMNSWNIKCWKALAFQRSQAVSIAHLRSGDRDASMFRNTYPTDLRMVMAAIHRRRMVAKSLEESAADSSFLDR